jgi:hypothetical protein
MEGAFWIYGDNGWPIELGGLMLERLLDDAPHVLPALRGHVGLLSA